MSLAETVDSDPCIVEIGSFKGKSTCWLAAGCKRRGAGTVTAIDHFQGSPEHQKGGIEETPEVVEHIGTRPAFETHINRYQLGDVVTVRQGQSWDTSGWDRPISMLFIDGDHSYDGTKRDFEAWSPFVKPGGLVCFHDFGNKLYLLGVTRFIVDEIYPKYEFALKVDSMVGFFMPGAQ